MASPPPVLPEVGSTIVPPGFSFPSRSAASIRGRPMRSLTEPPGFRYSSLTSTSGAIFWRRTIGVRPTSSSAVGNSRDIGTKLMPEVAAVGEGHRCACVPHRVDDVLVPFRAPGLDDRADAGFEGQLRAVRKGDERIRREHRAAQVVA